MLTSVNMSSGATCEYRRLRVVYVLYTPFDSASSSLEPPVMTRCPRLPATIAVPVSWQPGRTMLAAMLAFFNSSSATNRSFSDASGSSRMLESC